MMRIWKECSSQLINSKAQTEIERWNFFSLRFQSIQDKCWQWWCFSTKSNHLWYEKVETMRWAMMKHWNRVEFCVIIHEIRSITWSLKSHVQKRISSFLLLLLLLLSSSTERALISQFIFHICEFHVNIVIIYPRISLTNDCLINKNN